MAFIGLVFAGIFMVILGIAAFIGFVLIVIGLVCNHRDKKKYIRYKEQATSLPAGTAPYKRRIYPKVLIVIGALILIPVIVIVGKTALDLYNNDRYSHENFFSTLVEGYFDDAERLYNSGNICVDCAPSSNADFSIPAEDGKETILMHFCGRSSPDHKGYVDAVNFLIDHGADIERVKYSHKQNDPKHRNASQYKDFHKSDYDYCGINALMIACSAGNTEIVKLLVEKGADVNAKDYCGMTPLMYTADSFSGQFAGLIAEYLAAHGADLSVKDNFGQTVWDHIKYNDAYDVGIALENYR